ncbi:hypothetical protein TNCV_2694041 [Trichonephila clavipes]|nr:hypothetical protein TNCV_2694041 [Trichonephila clavipes]
MRKFLDQTESGNTELNESVPSTSQQHLYASEFPLNLEVTPDAPTIDTERQKSGIEVGSEAYQSKSHAEISVFTLNNMSHNEEEVEISSSPVNRDASDVVKQASGVTKNIRVPPANSGLEPQTQIRSASQPLGPLESRALPRSGVVRYAT